MIKIKTGILGGTFNPPHRGHLAMALSALKLPLDEVWVIPDGIPPHKELKGNALTYDRLNMVRILFDGIEKINIKTIETDKLFKNYTYLTMEYLFRTFPDRKFYYIIGEDSLDSFPDWVHPERISKCCDFIVIPREDNSTFNNLKKKCCDMGKRFGSIFYPIYQEKIDISSTDVREDLKNNRTSSLINSKELDYIRDHDLYIEEKAYTMTIDNIKSDLNKRLKPSRYEHTLGVAYTASCLAMRYSYPMEKAFLAGLLHDCAKNMSPDDLLETCIKNDIRVTNAEREMPYLLHSKVGAYLAKTRYKIDDKDILHAIEVHTTGCPDMNLLDKIIFCADYIEPNRNKAENLSEIRNQAFLDLDKAVIFILRDTISYLKNSGRMMDELTEKTYNYYKEHSDFLSF
ncbi:MAG: nicotinate (nicotinamide) nucleotide adenylyltransferase [Solobacterium sp.]|nr:nicotinate (nicotinamide) nucleotide adenylyltransferase [Solobacterium sp.]